MAPYRTSRTGNQRRAVSQPDHDVFEGLPVRHWRKRPISVSTNVERADPNASAVLPSGYPELPMPKDANQLSENGFALLRAARMGIIRKDVAEGGEDGRKGGDSDASLDEQNSLLTRKWALIPKETEEPEPEYLAKRRKGLPSLYGVDAVLKTKAGPMRKTKIRKLDTGGKNHVWEVLVPEGQSLDGEIGEDIISPTEVPLPGTVVEGLGVANANGVVVAGNQTGQTPPRRKPPPPRRKHKGRPSQRDRKRVAFAPQANGGPVSDGVMPEATAALDNEDRSLEAFPNSDGNLGADEDSLMPDAGQDGEDESDLGDDNDESREDQTNSHASPAPADGQEAQSLPMIKDPNVLAPDKVDDVGSSLPASLAAKGPSRVDTDDVNGSDPVPSTTDISELRAEDTPDSIYETADSLGSGVLAADSLSVAGFDNPIPKARANTVPSGEKEEAAAKDQQHPGATSDIPQEGHNTITKSSAQPLPVLLDLKNGKKDHSSVGTAPTTSEPPADDVNKSKELPSSTSPDLIKSTSEPYPQISVTDATASATTTTPNNTRSEPIDQDTPMLDVNDATTNPNNPSNPASAPQESSSSKAPAIITTVATEAPTSNTTNQQPPKVPAQTSQQLTTSPPQPRSVPLPPQFTTANAPTPSPPTPVTNSFDLKRTPLDSPRAPTMSPPTPAGDRSRTPDGQTATTSKSSLLQPSSLALDHSSSSASSSDPQKQRQPTAPPPPPPPPPTLPGLSAVTAAALPPPPPPPQPKQPSPPTTNTTTTAAAPTSIQEPTPIPVPVPETPIAVEAAPLIPDAHFDAEIPHAHNPLDGLAAPAPATSHTESNANANTDTKGNGGVVPGNDNDDDEDDGEIDLLGNFEKSLAAGSTAGAGDGDGEEVREGDKGE